ncbi:LSU ribosomal protein L2P [Giardia duodenalis]|uniref:LSU ribosomal protein L2P n=1 Tax=Giardia intestinalis TaxID=5741 RepID=V6TV73_GIAIN|nr:LSU ribosomal protein L2P [Giardia intestinalis]
MIISIIGRLFLLLYSSVDLFLYYAESEKTLAST